MVTFSANLGYLWRDLPLTEAIGRAAEAGFAAVELHWPYDVPAARVRAALAAAGLPCLGLNTARGGAGDFGLAALPGRDEAARDTIRQALDYAGEIGARYVHVLSGLARGPEAEAALETALAFACDLAGPDGPDILVEPLNARDVPGYFLSRSDQAAALIRRLGLPRLRLLFDCYHVQIMEGDLTRRIERHFDLIGHVQIAAVPDRGEPDRGEVDYAHICRLLDALGYPHPIGAEYAPRGGVEEGLGWRAALAART